MKKKEIEFDKIQSKKKKSTSSIVDIPTGRK
jgi:hypothetical protein